ncbi:calcium-binding protein, partial [Puniceibacterium confluentis]|uniref:calcium-binding protein n=1 Tax=Puniceibacterium confluentis TaxID=1958944 RepID=UPI0035628C02
AISVDSAGTVTGSQSVPATFVGWENASSVTLDNGNVAVLSRATATQAVTLQILGPDGATLSSTEVEGTFGTSEVEGIFYQLTAGLEVAEVGGRILALYRDSFTDTLFGQFFTQAGVADSGEFDISVGDHGDASNAAVFQDGLLEAAVLTDGRVAIAWADSLDGDINVWVTVLNPDGTVSVPEQQVNTGATAAGEQYHATVHALEGGGFAVTWNQNFVTSQEPGSFVQCFDADGTPVGDLITITAGPGAGVGYGAILPDGSGLLVDWYGNVTDLAGGDTSTQGLSLTGTEGNDTLTGSNGNDTLRGAGGDDALSGASGDDVMDGGDGNDGIQGNAGNDTLNGGPGDDQISGSDGDDVIDGGDGDDNIGGGLGDDSITGGAGNDTIGAGQGNDSVDGSGGNDVLAGGAGDDTLSGGDGNDVMGASYGVDSIDGGAGNDNIGGGFGRDTIDAGDGDDSVGGGEGDDSIEGGAGNDFLAGGGRNDTITGGTGADTINGGAGDDVLTGGADGDLFVFNALTDGEFDHLTDFAVGIDTLRLNAANGTNFDDLAFDSTAVDGIAGVQLALEGHVIFFAGLEQGELTAGDFLFV